MNLDEAFELARSRLDDETEDYLWKNADLLSYFNRRRNEFAQRTGYWTESNSAETCNLAILADIADYALDERIIEVKRAKPSWSTRVLTKRTCRYMDEYRSGWQDSASSTPSIWIPDKQEGYFTLWPTPNAAGTVSLTVTRLPLFQLRLTDLGNEASLAFPLMWHEDLLEGVLGLAYSKQDTDTYDPRKAAEHEGNWERFILKAIQHVTKTRDIDDSTLDEYGIYREAGF